MRFGVRAVFAAILLFAFHTLVSAQSTTTSLHGTVYDSKGALVSGAALSLTNVATGFSRAAKSDDHGTYQFLERKQQHRREDRTYAEPHGELLLPDFDLPESSIYRSHDLQKTWAAARSPHRLELQRRAFVPTILLQRRGASPHRWRLSGLIHSASGLVAVN